MRNLILSVALTATMLVAVPASAIFIDFAGGGVIWDKAGPIGWTTPELLAEVHGDEASGEYAEDVSANCASVSWAQAGVHAIERDGTKWTAKIGGRGYNTGVSKSDDCSIFIDFAGGGYTEDLPVEFD